jgi:hypothetical protein
MRILRYEVPVDDQFHELTIGEIVHVACRERENVVEVWAKDEGLWTRRFIVIGTGQEYDDGDLWYVATAVVPHVRLVWHLLAGQAKSHETEELREERS